MGYHEGMMDRSVQHAYSSLLDPLILPYECVIKLPMQQLLQDYKLLYCEDHKNVLLNKPLYALCPPIEDIMLESKQLDRDPAGTVFLFKRMLTKTDGEWFFKCFGDLYRVTWVIIKEVPTGAP